MKKILLLNLMMLCFSCTKNEEKIAFYSLPESIKVEEAFPGTEKELYHTSSDIVIEKVDSICIMQGDILLTPSQMSILDDSECVTRGAITKQIANYWRGCTVGYDFASDFTYQNYVQQALNDISAAADVKFVQRNSGDRIHFFHGNGNYSYIGCTGGAQDISIQKGQASYYLKGIVIHEVCHALGLFHEQSRVDRDKYIDILWDNIEKDKIHNFQTYVARGIPGADIAEFNFLSIMMYGPTSFAKVVDNVPQPTICKKDGSSYSIQRSYLAQSDIAAIHAIYGPPYAKMRTEIEVIREDYFYGDESYEANHHLYVDFYSDENCTKPTVLTSPRYLSVRYWEQNEPQSYMERYSVVVVPAGVSSFFIGTGYTFWHEIQGSLVGSMRSDYFVLNI